MTSFRVPHSRAHLMHQSIRGNLYEALESILFGPHELDNAALKPIESRFAEITNHRYAYGVNSGTAGLFLALKACGVVSNDEVITVGNSDISTTSAISHCGATPILCDVLESDYTIDPSKTVSLITDRTKALLPVDLYGHPADVQSLRSIADEHGFVIIEDAALAIGAYDHGYPVGAFADATVLSFGANKPLGSVGNGGMVLTNNSEVAERLELLRGYGRASATASCLWNCTEHSLEGYNLPLDPLEAAIVGCKARYLDEWTKRRREIAARYADGLRDLKIGTPVFRAESYPTFHTYTVRVGDRDVIMDALRDRGIQAALHYLPPVYRQPAYRNHRISTSNLPVTETLADEILCLPVAPELLDAEIDYVIESLNSLL